MTDQMKFCPYCGKPLAAEAAFCAYCGKQVPVNTMASSVSVPSKQNVSLSTNNTANSVPNNIQNYNNNQDDVNHYNSDNSGEQELDNGNFTNQDYGTIAIVTVLSILATRNGFGAMRSLVVGLLMVFGKRFYNQKRYVALVAAIIVAVLINTFLSIAMRSR